jgi:cysteine desulfurase / selenocysteine lyase
MYSNVDRRRFLSLFTAAAVQRPGFSFGDGRSRHQPGAGSFPALRQQIGGRPLTYLDSAATTLRPQAVIDALADFYTTDNANPSPVHTLARRAASRLTAARQTVARYINAPRPNEVVFTRGTTEGINLIAGTWAAANLRPGDEVVLTIAEHNSNLLPWTRAATQAGATLRVVDVDEDGRLRIEQLTQMISAKTRLIAFSHVSNVLGLVNPAKEICTLARQAGARVVIDGAQSVPHVSVDVQDLGCDFYVFSGHKMLGPMATGVVWGRLELLEAMPAYHVGSNMAHEVDFERASMEHGAQKFQAGTPDVAGPVGLAAAIDFLTAIGKEGMGRHDHDLVRHGLSRLREVKGLRIIGPTSAENRVPVFTFVIAGKSPATIADALDARGIAIRAGDMAALPLLKRFGVSEAARASAYVYSTTQDVDHLAEALVDIG